MLVRVTASPASEQSVIGALLGVREISASNVRLEIRVAP